MSAERSWNMSRVREVGIRTLRVGVALSVLGVAGSLAVRRLGSELQPNTAYVGTRVQLPAIPVPESTHQAPTRSLCSILYNRDEATTIRLIDSQRQEVIFKDPLCSKNEGSQ